MGTVKWLESKIISETQRAEYAEGRVRALLLELDKKDAALRRAKAEGMLAVAQLVEDDCYIEGGALLPDYEHRCKHNVNQEELAAKIRARAAQIEEGA